jgi:hypothetical protein
MTMTPTAPALCARSSSFRASSGYSQWERSQPPDAVGIAQLRRSHVLVDHTGGAQAHLLVAEIGVRGGERHNRNVDTGLVHGLNAQVVVEMAGLRGKELRAVGKDAMAAVASDTDRIFRATVLAQQVHPALAEHVRVYVYDSHVPSHQQRSLSYYYLTY